jgi:hypothetical protein
MVERFRPESQSKYMTSAPERLSLFGQPQLLEGENAADYRELVARLYAAVKPVDIIDEMHTQDVAFLEWDVLRWRRLKFELIRACALEPLGALLDERFGYDLRSEHFVEYLAEILQDNLPEDQANSARKLAYKCTRDNADAVDKVNNVLAGIKLDMDQVETGARAQKIRELVQEYMQHKPDAVALIQDLLAAAGQSMDALLADQLVQRRDYLEYIERIDRLTAIAESRRNVSLREIDRRRAVLGETLRRSVQEIEDAEFKVIETTPSKGKNAA